jgi:cation diffusion facilitator CzcD-associated flavoprotein CzcO
MSARGEHTVSETDAPTQHTGDASGEHVDVLIVGAGISGVGAAYHLTTQRPGTSFVVLETLESFGGTWRTHTYPGIRSDSDLYTFGYRFKPWIGPPIATAEEILTYMGEVIDENDLGRHIRYRHRIDRAEWSSNDKRWTLEVTRTDPDTGATEPLRFTCNFLWMCQGYYRHEQGYTPDWPGLDQYQGEVVHPQTWPDDIELEGKRVVVIGSGATAATLVPNIADQCEHVTVLQRSPTYFWADRNTNELVEQLRELDVPPEWIHEIARRKVLRDQAAVTQLCIDEPEFAKQELINAVRARLPEGYDVDKHFTPAYRPWQQRLAFVPDGDLFAGISSGKASMVTDHIETFTEKGIVTASGEELIADVVITATGFNMNVLGDIDFVIDGEPLVFSDTITYRGMMFTGVPNMVWVFGYFRASWTLRADLISDFVCRLLGHMEDKGARQVTPALRPDDADMQILPWVDAESFNPNYLLRAAHLLPKRGDTPEWQHSQDYWTEKDTLPAIDLDDGCLVYE